MKYRFTVIAAKWRDKVNGNTYHSVRCIRHSDGAICVGRFQYGYGNQYQQTALYAMANNGWLTKEYPHNHYDTTVTKVYFK